MYRITYCGTKPGHFETSNHSLSHELGSEQMSAAERASEAYLLVGRTILAEMSSVAMFRSLEAELDCTKSTTY